MTVAEFVGTLFLPGHVAFKTTAGRRHYQAILKHVICPDEVDRMFGVEQERQRTRLKADPHWPYLGHIRLDCVTVDDVRQLVSVALDRGYSAQTVKHIRNVVRSILAHAIRGRHMAGENPADSVASPESEKRELQYLTLSQTVQLLEYMRYPEREIALMAILTNMTIAEICGLQWMNVNISDCALSREGVAIPARSLVVRTQWYRGELAPVPESRRKCIAIPPLLLRVIRNLAAGRACGWHDYVFATKTGKPINQINLAARRLKRIGKQVGMPWLSWQVLRRTRLSIFMEYEARVQDQLSKVVFPRLSPLSLNRAVDGEQLR